MNNEELLNTIKDTDTIIDDTLYEQLLEKEDDVVKNLLWYQPITVDRFMKIAGKLTDPYMVAELGKNQKVDPEIVMALLESDNVVLLENIAANRSVPAHILKALHDKLIKSTLYPLAGNPNLPNYVIEEIYGSYRNDAEMLQQIASNPTTPEEILRELQERNDPQINTFLAENPATPA